MDPETCPHEQVNCDHQQHRSTCLDCTTTWPFETCGLTDEQLAERMAADAPCPRHLWEL